MVRRKALGNLEGFFLGLRGSPSQKTIEFSDLKKIRFCYVQVQVTVSPGLMWETTNVLTPSWKVVMAWDMGFRLPNNTGKIFGRKGRRYTNSCEVDYFLHRRERRELYRSIEGILDA